MSGEARILALTLDEASIPERKAETEHELKTAIHDLLAENAFAPEGAGQGPYTVHLSVEEKRLIFALTAVDGRKTRIGLSVQPLKILIKDYFLICESYYEAIKAHNPSRLEAIDMGRRGLHNEGAEKLMEMLENKITVDLCTARRLFTLICALHLK